MGICSVACVNAGSGRRPAGPATPWRQLPDLLLEWADGAWRLELAGQAAVDVPAGRVLVVAPERRHRLIARKDLRTHWRLLRVEVDGVRILVGAALPALLPSPASRRIQVLLAPETIPAGAAGQLAAGQAQLAAIGEVLAAAPPLADPQPQGPLARMAAAWAAAEVLPAGRLALARLAGMSLTRLHHRFVDGFGLPPAAWLRRERLRRARDLLAGGDLPIAAVAERCGFPDVYAFSRVFRRCEGVAPSRWRQALRGA